MNLWRIATETPLYRADDTSGAVAARNPGRWNDLAVHAERVALINPAHGDAAKITPTVVRAFDDDKLFRRVR